MAQDTEGKGLSTATPALAQHITPPCLLRCAVLIRAFVLCAVDLLGVAILQHRASQQHPVASRLEGGFYHGMRFATCRVFAAFGLCSSFS